MSIIAIALLRSPLQLLLRLWLLQLVPLRLGSGRQRARCCFLLFLLSLAPISFFTISHPLPLRLNSGPLRPCRHCAPVRLPFWLLSMFVDGLAPSASEVRCPHRSTKRSSTTSCVCSTHHSLLALNSFPSFLQRILLAFVISSFPSCPSWALALLRSS